MELTADTRLGGTVDGSYSATVVATGGGRTVRTPAAVDRESESYDVTFKTLGRDGAPSTAWHADLKGYRESAAGLRFFPDLSSGSTTTVRLPRGTYSLAADLLADPAAPAKCRSDQQSGAVGDRSHDGHLDARPPGP